MLANVKAGWLLTSIPSEGTIWRTQTCASHALRGITKELGLLMIDVVLAYKRLEVTTIEVEHAGVGRVVWQLMEVAGDIPG